MTRKCMVKAALWCPVELGHVPHTSHPACFTTPAKLGCIKIEPSLWRRRSYMRQLAWVHEGAASVGSVCLCAVPSPRHPHHHHVFLYHVLLYAAPPHLLLLPTTHYPRLPRITRCYARVEHAVNMSHCTTHLRQNLSVDARSIMLPSSLLPMPGLVTAASTKAKH